MPCNCFIFSTLAIAIATIATAFADEPAAVPTTGPTSRSTTQPAADAVLRSLADLLAPDPTVRSQAKASLMLLTRDDLPWLRDVVATVRPLRPAQRAALREVVMHVYLTGEHNFVGPGRGILGVEILGVDLAVSGPPPSIMSRRLGYDAFRMLEDGDVIVGITIAGGEMQSIGDFAQLRDKLSVTHVGDFVTVRVVRNGQQKEVGVRVGPEAARVLVNEPDLRTVEAERYWTETFEAGTRTR